jgi:hypothetical protein
MNSCPFGPLPETTKNMNFLDFHPNRQILPFGLLALLGSTSACAPPPPIANQGGIVTIEAPQAVSAPMSPRLGLLNITSSTLEGAGARVLAVTDLHLWVGTWSGSLLRYSLDSLSNDRIVKNAVRPQASSVRLVVMGQVLVVIDNLSLTARNAITGDVLDHFEVDDHSSINVHDVDGTLFFYVPHAEGEAGKPRRMNVDSGKFEIVDKIPQSALEIGSNEAGGKDVKFRAPDGQVHESEMFRPGIEVTARLVGNVAVVLSTPRPGSKDDQVLERPLEFALLPRAASGPRNLPGRYAKYFFDAGSALWIGSHMLSGPIVFTLVDKRSQEILTSAVMRDDAQGGCVSSDAAAGGPNVLAFLEVGPECRPLIRVLRVSR